MSDSEQCSSRLQLDLISILVNFSYMRKIVFAIQKANLVDIQSSRFWWYSFVFERTQSHLVYCYTRTDLLVILKLSWFIIILNFISTVNCDNLVQFQINDLTQLDTELLHALHFCHKINLILIWYHHAGVCDNGDLVWWRYLCYIQTIQQILRFSSELIILIFIDIYHLNIIYFLIYFDKLSHYAIQLSW